jgi:preprotein translocase subunit Sec61beta
MSDKKQLRAPMGMAGLVRYDEEEESLIKLKPEFVVAIGVALIIIELILLFLVPV